MSWIKSASTFLDQLDTDVGQAAKDGVVTKAAGGVLEQAKREAMNALAAVEDQGIFTDSDEEEGGAEKSAAAEEPVVLAPAAPPPVAPVRFKPAVSAAIAVSRMAPESPSGAAAPMPEPAAAASPPAVAVDVSPSVAAAAPTAAAEPTAVGGGGSALEAALKGELEESSSSLAQLRVSHRETDDALATCKAEYATTVAGYEANLDEFDKERSELRKSNDELRGKLLTMERMLTTASATKSDFESISGAALEAKNAELKETAMHVSESKATAEEAWRQLTMLTAERDGLLRKVAEQERASHALSQLAGDREEGVQAAQIERAAHEKTKREIVQMQGSISSLEAQNASYARLLASTQKSLEERNMAYASLAPKNRELTQRCTDQEKALAEERADSASKQAQLSEAVSAKEQAKTALAVAEDELSELNEQLTAAEGAAAGRITSAAAAEKSDSGAGGSAHDSGLEVRLGALQEHLSEKVAELSRVNSERTALQLRCDKLSKGAFSFKRTGFLIQNNEFMLTKLCCCEAAREQELLQASATSWGQVRFLSISHRSPISH